MTTATRRALAAAALAALLAPAAAPADSACVEDAQRLCAGMAIGEGRVLDCLRRRGNEVSGPCLRDLQAVERLSREITVACAADVWAYCQGVVPGGGRVKECLYGRWPQLSSTCKDEASRLAEKEQALWDACTADAAQLCPEMKPGGGFVFLCLKAQESRASAACQRALRR